MELITREEITELANEHSDPCISVYVPTHQSGMEVNEGHDLILFKNGLQQVKNVLEERGTDPVKIDALLKQGFALLKEEKFWNNLGEGLAVFISEKTFKTVVLPYTVKEETIINSAFYVTPLLQAVSKPCPFYLLVLSKDNARFYEGDKYQLKELEVEGLPYGVDDVVHFEDKDDQRLFRRGSSAGREGGGSYHGHVEGQADNKQTIALYFQEVDRTLFAEVLHDKTAPLILAAVEYQIPIYKGITKYNHVWEEGIIGNSDHESERTLHQQACELLKPYFKQNVNKALENYYNQIAGPLTSSMPETVIPASHYARVADLFVCRDEHIWGRFNEADNALEIHPEKQDGDDCLINSAAVKVMANGGDVHVLDREKMPKESIIAASLRY
ncbi:hypothetical protein EOD41_11375 [Mucilaginibacter limnophilus]|uniref:Uncharacterized protein n=1 Tax=Mucilaginibacter limnophilus TaxID=1932778 RepID=A0A3S3TGM5_9SPHI|nr:hypothetical protein [Mucilaginibacter limnophilus]RVU00595.1 hypothetical protein EOD41_11375 [Mucilaginibacter limnophilus]